MTVVINIKGGSATKKKHTRTMVEFCIDMLMPRMKTLEINVHIKDFKDDNSYGYALATDDADDNRPREFDVDINKDTRLRRLLETVAHEMVHVKQFARGELNEKPAWLGKTYNINKTEYWDLPWEIEAHGREVGMFIRWCNENNYGQKWTEDN